MVTYSEYPKGVTAGKDRHLTNKVKRLPKAVRMRHVVRLVLKSRYGTDQTKACGEEDPYIFYKKVQALFDETGSPFLSVCEGRGSSHEIICIKLKVIPEIMAGV